MRILKLTKQELQGKCKKQQVDCENQTDDDMTALLLCGGKLRGAAAAEHPSQWDEVQLKELELEKLLLKLKWKKEHKIKTSHGASQLKQP